MTPGERWIQRVMGNLGARPVGHAEPAEDETAPAAPVIPLQPSAPAPDWPPAGRRISASSAPGSLPAPGQTIDLTASAATATAGKEAPEGEEEAVEDDGQEDSEEAPVEASPSAGPAPGGPVAKTPPGASPVRKGKGKGKSKSKTDDPNLRITVFNLTAAAVGYGTGLVAWFGHFLPYAEQAARGIFGLLLAVAGAVAGWRLFGTQAVRAILPGSIRGVPTPAFLWQAGAAAGLAELARAQAPAAVDWLNSYGTRYGLGPSTVSLLLTALGMCGGLWWFIDRRARHKHWLARWVLRVPLSSALLATALYAPGAVS